MKEEKVLPGLVHHNHHNNLANEARQQGLNEENECMKRARMMNFFSTKKHLANNNHRSDHPIPPFLFSFTVAYWLNNYYIISKSTLNAARLNQIFCVSILIEKFDPIKNLFNGYDEISSHLQLFRFEIVYFSELISTDQTTC